MTGLPLLGQDDPAAPFAHYEGRIVPVRRFLSDVAGLAEILPGRPEMMNLCRNRYRFAVAFGAALTRGQVTLLPPNTAPGTLADLARAHADAYAFTDEGQDAGAFPTLRYTDIEAETGAAMPVFPAERVAAILFTSGSTGAPKPFARSWGAMVASAESAGTRLRAARFRGGTIVATVPHQHSYGLESSVMLGLRHGLILDDARPLLPADVVARLEAAPRPRLLVTAPVHLAALLAEAGSLPQADLILSATSPLSPPLAIEAETRFGCALHEIYGCSEAGQLATRRTSETAEWICLDGITLEQAADGICATGKPVASSQSLNDEIERLSPTRFLLHGRKADLVNIAGKRGSLAHLTHHLTAIPGVADGLFVMPAEEDRPMAFAVAPGMSAEEIMRHLKRNLDPAFLPRPLVLLDRLPRNELGKLPRAALLRLAAEARRP